MAGMWGISFDNAANTADNELMTEARRRYKEAEDFEAIARVRFEYDYKFAHGDTHNKYQWDADLVANRELLDKPCLTVNKVQQHNLLIINDGRMNKPGARIRPVGDEATYEAAQIYQEIIYHIENISSAENVYDHARQFQVNGGWGYWRLTTEPISTRTFDKEIKIKWIKDPKSVYLDPNTNEPDRLDARWGFIFDDMAKELFGKTYPDFKDRVGQNTVFNQSPNNWITQNYIKVARYYYKEEKKEKLVAFNDPEQDQQILKYFSELTPTEKLIYNEIKRRESTLSPDLRSYRERNVVTENVKWVDIAGDIIIDRGDWLGKYIPIIFLGGTVTLIDNIWDCKGHTRALIDPQRIYNYNTSANVEYGALQTKSPWVTAVEAIENFEEYYRTANTSNRAYMPYNAFDEEGNPLPPPKREPPPQPGLAYVEQMKIAQNELMMASGQYQAQMGENENAKSGVAINSRQRQGDKATFHFIDNEAIAIRATAKQLLDLIPKVYDTKRIMQIEARDNRLINLQIDPNAKDAITKLPLTPEQQELARTKQVENLVFNPKVGYYDLMPDAGPSFATRRMEAFNALTQIAAQNPQFMNVAGDILWKVADFPEAQILAERWRKLIPPNITGDAPDPQTEQAMHAAADKIEQQLAIIAQQAKELADKSREFDIKEKELDLRFKEAVVRENRADYDAETKRLTAFGNSGPAISVEQIQPALQQLLIGMLNAGEPGKGDKLAKFLEENAAKTQTPEIKTNGAGLENAQ